MIDLNTTPDIYRSPKTPLDTVMATRDKSRDALGDSGATSNFVPVEAAGDPSDWNTCRGSAIAANNQSMPVRGAHAMQWQELPPQTHKVLEGLNDTILSVPRLADQGLCSVFLKDCWLVIDESTFRMNESARIMAQGYREPNGGLYRMGNQTVPLYNSQRVNTLVQPPSNSEYGEDENDDDNENTVHERCFAISTVNTYYSQVKVRSVAERAAFYHATFGFPVLSTMYKAMARHMPLPGLTHHELADNAPKTVHTSRGHLHELPQGQGSTKPVNESLADERTPDVTNKTIADQNGIAKADTAVSEKVAADPAELQKLSDDRQLPRNITPGYLMDIPDDSPVKMGEWFIHKSESLAADATGKMSVPSYMGHTAVWVAYHPATGYVRAIPVRSKAEISRTLEFLYSETIRNGHIVKTIYIDNEIDNDARAFFIGHSVRVNNVAPYNHRANPAERAIGTFKDHFISILSGRDPTCPLSYWNEAVLHAEITINMMRPGPNGKSAYEAYWGKAYDLNANPLVPWGTRCEAYVPKALRTTYGYRSQPAFYVGVSYNGYRGHRLISIDSDKKASVYVRQQVVFHPWEVPFLKWSEMDDLKERVSDLAKTMMKMHGKTNAKTSNAAEALKAYCDSIITEEEDEAGEKRERYAAGSGQIYWLGPQKIDTATGAVIDEIQPPDDYEPAPLPIAVTPAVTPVSMPTTPLVTETPALSIEQQTPAQLLGLDPEPAAQEQTPILHVRVSEGVQLNTEEDMHPSEGDLAAPKHMPVALERQSRSQTKEKKRQEMLDELAKAKIDRQSRINVVVDSRHVVFDDEDPDEEKWHVVQGKTRKVYSRFSKTYRNSKMRNHRVSVLKEDDHKTLRMRGAMKLDPESVALWKQALAEELERYLAMPSLFLLKPEERPYYHRARKIIMVLEHKTGKDRRVRAAFDGSSQENRTEQYTQYSSDIDTKKIFWAALATAGVEGYRHCTMDIAAFFLHNRNMLEGTVEHLFFPAGDLPDAYKARFASYIGDDGNIMFECGQAVYGMYNAGTIAGRVLGETLIAADYVEVGLQSCMWRSKKPGEEKVLFNINVDDMGFLGHPDLGHKERLLKVLAADGYEVSHTEFSDPIQNFCGYQVVHDTVANTVMVSMPGYVDNMITTFGMENAKVQDHPYRYTQPAFSAKQSPAKEDESKLLTDKEIKELQQKLGKLQWYTGLCYEIVTIVAKIASAQARPTAKQLKDVNHVIAYLAGHKNTALFFNASNMQLSLESDASFASESKSKSRIGGVFLIGGYGPDGLPINSPIGVFSKIADCHPDSAAEAEYVACHDVVKRGVSLRTTLEEFGFPQVNATENRSDNECAVNMANDLVMDRKTKHIDRRYHWVRHELKKGTFKVKWYKGSSNLADFFTKLLSKDQHARFTQIFTKQYIAEGVLGLRPLNPTIPIAGQSD